jgi:hypothetical protein
MLALTAVPSASVVKIAPDNRALVVVDSSGSCPSATKHPPNNAAASTNDTLDTMRIWRGSCLGGWSVTSAKPVPPLTNCSQRESLFG